MFTIIHSDISMWLISNYHKTLCPKSQTTTFFNFSGDVRKRDWVYYNIKIM